MDTLAVINKIFHPKSIAVAGASGNVSNMGSRTVKLLKDFGYKGRLFAVNPKAEASYGVPGYRRVSDIDESVDFCIIAVPASQVVGVVADCVDKGVRAAQILTSGFGETGTDGREMERDVLKAIKGKMRLVGPNCVGVYSPASKLTLVANAEEAEGEVAICSQSGGLSVEMVLQAKSRGLLLGKVISIGNSIDLDPVDFLHYFAQDPETKVIGFYLEGLRRGKPFFDALKQVTSTKPVVVLKGGRTSLGAQSVSSHTNSLAGEYSIWRTAIAQAGAIIVDTVDDFLATLAALQHFVPRPQGNGIALAGNGGGATVLATDALAESGLTLAQIGEQTKQALANIDLPPGSSMGNAIDMPANALIKSGGEALGELVRCMLGDSVVSGCLVHFNLLPFLSYDNREQTVDGICKALQSFSGSGKPVYVTVRGIPDPQIEHLRQRILQAARRAQLPCFPSNQEAIRTMAKIYEWSKRPPVITRDPLAIPPESAIEQAEAIVEEARHKGLSALPQVDAYRVLDLFDIPHPPVRLVHSAEDAVRAAQEMEFPVVLKVDSPEILHKTDVGGVRVHLTSEKEVEEAFHSIYASVRQTEPESEINGIVVQSMTPKPVAEMICGLKRDPVFGPVILLGMGGVLVEVMRDASMRILPATKDELSRMWQEIGGAPLLTGYRGKERGDTEALEDLVQKVAALGQHVPGIAEMDVNPVMVMGEGKGVSVVDCRIILQRGSL